MSRACFRLSLLPCRLSLLPMVERKLITAVKQVMRQGVSNQVSPLSRTQSLSDANPAPLLYLFTGSRKGQSINSQPSASAIISMSTGIDIPG